MEQIPVYIMAGGKSSRFGSDKALAILAGTPLIQRVAEGIRPVAESITVVAADKDRYAHLGLETIADLVPACGPLGGLHTALDDLGRRKQSWLMLLACDWAVVKAAWARQLLESTEKECDAVAFRDEQWQPLMALYRCSAGTVVQEHLQARKLAMWRLLDRLHTIALPLPSDWSEGTQINTQAQYTRYLKHLR